MNSIPRLLCWWLTASKLLPRRLRIPFHHLYKLVQFCRAMIYISWRISLFISSWMLSRASSEHFPKFQVTQSNFAYTNHHLKQRGYSYLISSGLICKIVPCKYRKPAEQIVSFKIELEHLFVTIFIAVFHNFKSLNSCILCNIKLLLHSLKDFSSSSLTPIGIKAIISIKGEFLAEHNALHWNTLSGDKEIILLPSGTSS